jgi:hypothetical protein
MVPPASGATIPSKNPTKEIRPTGKQAEAMNYAAMPAMATAGKKQAKTKKAAKDVTVEERQAEYEKRASRREAAGLLFNPGRQPRAAITVGLDARSPG